jgi:hypothetical protein
MQQLKTDDTVKTSSIATGYTSPFGTQPLNATVEKAFPQHEVIAAYWSLVGAFEQVNRTLFDPSRDAALKAIIHARCAVLSELPAGLSLEIAADSTHHEAIADRRRYLQRLEFMARKAGE